MKFIELVGRLLESCGASKQLVNVTEKLLEGFVNERVNMSDWETKRKIGAVFYGSCWCETSLILSFAELLPYPEFQNL